jgi:hypothetical protein
VSANFGGRNMGEARKRRSVGRLVKRRRDDKRDKLAMRLIIPGF